MVDKVRLIRAEDAERVVSEILDDTVGYRARSRLQTAVEEIKVLPEVEAVTVDQAIKLTGEIIQSYIAEYDCNSQHSEDYCRGVLQGMRKAQDIVRSAFAEFGQVALERGNTDGYEGKTD